VQKKTMLLFLLAHKIQRRYKCYTKLLEVNTALLSWCTCWKKKM